MAPEKDYTLISVSSDEEDDIVIQAGATNVAVSQDAEEGVEDVQHEVVQDVQTQRKEATPTNSMLTSEDDLHAPMPYAGMQRIIFAVFALLLIAAVAYWVFIRPVSG